MNKQEFLKRNQSHEVNIKDYYGEGGTAAIIDLLETQENFVVWRMERNNEIAYVEEYASMKSYENDEQSISGFYCTWNINA